MTTKAKTKTKALPYVVIGNERYGLYCGELVSHDLATRSAVVRGCRHIAQWYGRTGGITSLAAHGLCGTRANDSRIGAPCNATLTGVVNIFECSPEARATLEEAVQS
jgi:hypothetical protein